MKLRRCSMKDFARQIQGKKIVCYGIGNEFELIMKSYSEYSWIDKIGYLLDNNPHKKGRKIRIKDRNYTVIDLSDLKTLGDDSLVILPTCAAFAEIIDELNGYSWLDGIDCYVFHCMFNMSEGRIKIKTTNEIRIPAKIHYCWFGGKKMPENYKENVESWKRYCPDYDVIEWNENNLDVAEIPFTKEAYESGQYGFVPDYFRLKIIYEQGGIYLDTDVEAVKSLDDLRYNEAFCGMEYPGRIAFGLGFGAAKHNEIIRSLMTYYEARHFIRPDGSYDNIPSPEIQSQMLYDRGVKCTAAFQCFNGLSVYPVDVLSPQNPYTGELRLTDNTYSIHQFAGSWVSEDNKSETQKRIEKARKILDMIE